MSMRNPTRLNRNPLALALAGLLALPSATVLSQEQPATQANPSAQEEQEEDQTQAPQLDQVVVTGSRIARDTFNSVSPIQVITREETTVAGFNSTAGVLQSTAVTGGSEQINNSYGGFVVNGGPGVNTLSLRGLGATRTLLLLNGRRVAPAGSRGAVGSADLNVLPNIMVERIEVLKDGASSIYGSDAVAGVVNIITRQKVDGVTTEFQQNVTEHGGGNETRASIMAGKTGDDWRISGSLELYRRTEMTLGQRDWASKCPVPLLGRKADGSYGARDYIDPTTGEPKCWSLDAGGVTINTLGTAYRLGVAAPGGFGYYGSFYADEFPSMPFYPMDYFNRWRPNGSVTTGFAGFEGVDLNSRTTFEPNMLRESLVSPTKNYTGFLQGGKDLHALGDAELYFEILAHRRNSSQNGYLQHTVDYPRGSPLLGAYRFLTGTAVGAPADGSTNGLPIVARAFVGWGIYRNKQTVDFNRSTVGLRGDLGSSSWNYDLYVSHAKSDADYMTQNRLTDRIASALRVVPDGAGGFICADAAARAEGCVAAPVLTPAVIAGNLPESYRNYIMQWTKGNTKYSESTVNLGVNGPLFDMWHGTAYGAFGLEHRRAKIDDTPDINSINSNLYGFTSSTPTRGSDSVNEAYAELELPLIKGVRGAEELSVNLSARYTDYKSYGDDTTYKFGLLYTPVNWLSLRASHGTSFRAPALFEQHLGATSGFIQATNDPCNEWALATDQTSNRYLNCRSLGLPNNYTATNSVTVFTKGGAETGLSAETSTATTAGLVFQPTFPDAFGTLSFAADYYDIKVDNGVARLTGGQVLSLCYGSSPDEFAARSGYCSLVTRAANNSLTVTTGYINVTSSVVRGWDFTARYVRDIGPGSFRATAQVSHYLEQGYQSLSSEPYRDRNGTIGAPDFTGNLDLSYTVRNWLFRYGLDWVGGVSDYAYYDSYYNTDYRPTYLMEIDDYFLHSLSVRYSGDKWSVTGGVRNIADKTPPIVSTGATTTIGNAPLSSSYDYLGRSYFVRFSKTF